MDGEQSIILEKEKIGQHPMEGSVLVHGFLGNINKSEIDTFSQLLTKGAIASPAKRELSKDEASRVQDVTFDNERLCFHTWKDHQDNKNTYIDSAVWAAPTTVLEDTIIGDDISGEGGDSFSYRKGGVEISLSKGLLFVGDNFLDGFDILQLIQETAKTEGLTPEEWCRKHVVIIPSEDLKNKKELWKHIKQRITPAKGVTAEYVTQDELNNNGRWNYVNDLEAIHEPVKVEELGDTNLIEGEPLAPETVKKWKQKLEEFKAELVTIGETMEDDPLRIEELRDSRYMYDEGWHFHALKKKIDVFASNTTLSQEASTLDLLRRKLFEANQLILASKYPDAPRGDQITREMRWQGYNTYDTYVYRGKDGRYWVSKPDI